VLGKLLLSLVIVLAFSYSGFTQRPSERIPQSIIINGQQADGAFVVQDGTIQSQICASPQQYVTANRSSSGWACFEEATRTWLLQARPVIQAATPRQGPTIIYSYSQPAPVYVPAPVYSYPYNQYQYPYPYYPYPYSYSYGAYPFIWGPTFGFGFGFARSPIAVRGPFVNRAFIGRPFVGRPVAPFAGSRSFGGFRHGGVGRGFGHVGRR
jgi:hypothetical protein